MTDETSASTANMRSIASQMERFDRAALLAGLAGLTIDWGNASKHLRLSMLVEVGASLAPTSAQSAPRTNQVRRLVNGVYAKRLVAMLEDPAEYPLTEPVFFQGRSHVLFTGQQEEGAYRLSRLLDVFDQAHSGSPFSAAEPRRLIEAALGLSSAVAERATVGSGVPAETREDVVVNEASLDGLAKSVRWARAELDALLAADGTDAAALEPLIVSAGSAQVARGEPLDELSRHPIIEFADGEVVVVPGLFASALTHALLSWAHANGHLGALGEALSGSVTASVGEALSRALHVRPIDAALTDPAVPATVEELVAAIDDDAAMVVMVVSDPLEGFDPSKYGEGIQLGDKIEKQIAARVEAVTSWLLDPARPFEQVLVVLVGAVPAGRWLGFGLTYKPAAGVELLVLSPGALEIIAYNEAGDPLALMRYAKSLTALYEKTHIQSTHPLDEYAIYAQHGHSFYMSDDRAPAGIWVTPGMGIDQRQKFLDRTRRQSAEFPSGVNIEVWARYEERAPIFVPRSPRGQSCHLVRLDGVDVWILGAPWSMVSPAMRSMYEEFVNAAAYWVWQAGPAPEPTERLPPPQLPAAPVLARPALARWCSKYAARRMTGPSLTRIEASAADGSTHRPPRRPGTTFA